MFDRYLTAEFYQSLCSNEFNSGYLTGAGSVVGILILLVLIRMVLKILFRRRRCTQIVVSAPTGDLTISRSAVEGTTRQVLSAFGELDIRRIRLYRKGKNYSLLLYCTFFAGGKGVPEISEKIREKIRVTLQTQFGISTLQRIDFRVEELEGSTTDGTSENEEENKEFDADLGI